MSHDAHLDAFYHQFATLDPESALSVVSRWLENNYFHNAAAALARLVAELRGEFETLAYANGF